MEFKILCTMMILNIAMLLANIWLRFDSEKTLDEIKKRGGFDDSQSDKIDL